MNLQSPTTTPSYPDGRRSDLNADLNANPIRQFVSFVVAGEEFGISILKVQEIIRPVATTQMPHAPAFVEGIINLRGRIVPVVDLRRRFGFALRPQDDQTRVVVIEMENGVVGFVADAVREVLRVETSNIEPAPELAVGIDAHYLRGVAKLNGRLLILLHLEGVFSTQEANALGNLRKGQSATTEQESESHEEAPKLQAA